MVTIESPGEHVRSVGVLALWRATPGAATPGAMEELAAGIAAYEDRALAEELAPDDASLLSPNPLAHGVGLR